MAESKDLSEKPRISVIITAYDYRSEKSIFGLIDSLNNQTYQNIELIFVIEKSKQLFDSVRKYTILKELISAKVLMNEGATGASASRNLGIKSASGEIIAFVDDDVMLSNQWADFVIQTFALNDSYIGAIGPVMPMWEDPAMGWFPVELEWLISCTGWFQYRGVYPMRGHTWTSNAAFRKEAFENGTVFSELLGPRGGVAGWKKNAISEDVELSMRIQARTKKAVVYNSEMIAWKRVRKDLLSWSRIKDCAFGIGLSRVTKKQLFTDNRNESLTLESDLLKRLVFKLVPRTLTDCFTNREAARHRFSIIIFSLFFLGTGYISGMMLRRTILH